jgi:OOP family OmpA-OmpF porin
VFDFLREKRKGEAKMNKKAVGLSLSIVLLTCMPLSVQAENEFIFEEGDIYVTAMQSAIFYLDDSQIDLKTGYMLGGRAGLFLTDNISLELSFDYSWTEFNNPPFPYIDRYANNYSGLVNALYHFRPIADNLSPYLLGGIGYTRLRADQLEENGFAGNAGAGLHYGLSDYFLVRGEVRYLGATNPTQHNIIASLGLAFNVPYCREAPPPPPPPPVWGDFDEDGVPDHLDKCPTTPKGCIVDKDGCPLDADVDGVCDGLDECPDTPLGTMVDEKGCPIRPKTVALSWAQGLTFALGSAKLTKSAEGVLNDLVALANKHPMVVVEIGGYTDSTGSVVFNQRLSERRAMSVRNYMVLNGVTPDRLIPVGYGETNFVATNDTPEGRQQNRRVEFKFLGEDALGLPLLHFKLGKSELTDQSMSDLNGIADKLKANPNVRVQVAAYTDSSGSAELNKRLSLKRAAMVKDALVEKGVAAENLKPVGRGATNFLTTNATKEGRNMNRRVEFTIFWK